MIVLGTRGSELALAQTALVKAALRDMEVMVKVITTRGDETTGRSEAPVDRRAGRKGLFTGEIERALLDREIDIAVHSAKDLPSDAAPGLEVCAVLPRAQVEDVLVTKSAADLAGLPAEATVATGSVRRQHQLRWVRSDLKVVDLRGNVPTRLRKLTTNPWDAIILARAGLERLGFECSSGSIDFEGQLLRTSMLRTVDFLPAGGQGIVALQIRTDDVATRDALSKLNHHETLLCLRAEREFLRLLQGDCDTPVGVLATMEEGSLNLRAQVFKEMGAKPEAAGSVRNPLDRSPELIAARLFAFMYGEKK